MDSQTKRSSYRLGFLGAGKLAGSVIRGLLRAQFCLPNEILASEPHEGLRQSLKSELGIAVTNDNAGATRSAEVLFLGVKPAVVLPVLREVSDAAAGKLVISLAAGVRLQAMESATPGRVLRALTNTPSAICRAATGLARGSRSTEEDFEIASKIFGAIGLALEVTEEQIDVVTALSGSGPAFVYKVIEALAQGGANLGLPDQTALRLAAQTVLGAAQLAAETEMSPEDLIKMVVTPGGTTAAGLAIMEKQGVSEGIIGAVEAATKRGQEMAKENA